MLLSIYSEHASFWCHAIVSQHTLSIVFQPSSPPGEHSQITSAQKSHAGLKPFPTPRETMVDAVTYTVILSSPEIFFFRVSVVLQSYLYWYWLYNFCSSYLCELQLCGHLFHGAIIPVTFLSPQHHVQLEDRAVLSVAMSTAGVQQMAWR